jgi:hypothetical protein
MTAGPPPAACPEGRAASRAHRPGLPEPRRTLSCRASRHGGCPFRANPRGGRVGAPSPLCRPAPATPQPAEASRGATVHHHEHTSEALPERSTSPGTAPPRGELWSQALVSRCAAALAAIPFGSEEPPVVVARAWARSPRRAASVPAPSEEGAERDAVRIRRRSTVSPPGRRPRAVASRPQSVEPVDPAIRPARPEGRSGGSQDRWLRVEYPAPKGWGSGAKPWLPVRLPPPRRGERARGEAGGPGCLSHSRRRG